jgi:hypothetical protein
MALLLSAGYAFMDSGCSCVLHLLPPPLPQVMVTKEVGEAVGGLKKLVPTGTCVLIEGLLAETPEGTKQVRAGTATRPGSLAATQPSTSNSSSNSSAGGYMASNPSSSSFQQDWWQQLPLQELPASINGISSSVQQQRTANLLYSSCTAVYM